ncbi:uncharacterized protein K452DRAFT_35383 [Aplosporella prunicola CBS 121167]|uniref:F-box domain-containing protein n=1 Tax=Aplosporella prunicola CBS 121167 TaxID=1176127 RepID=A0A6A6AUD9_9PEZI|nr:uncharacterized protein K452DRAFT_35383 [Aplosporella prunicola CBS 121167]KAF2135310.1 hypothetical protein K452DRAFT_35383 [Aplosporella prunicola CBS 121167]
MPLASLPLELRESIVDYLRPTRPRTGISVNTILEDLHNARLSCRPLYEASWGAFGRTLWLRKFRLVQSHLNLLTSFSKIAYLAATVRTLSFGIERFSADAFRSFENWIDRAQTEEIRAQRRATYLQYKAITTSEQQLHASGKAAQMLDAALRNFPNLREVVVFVPREWKSTLPFWPGCTEQDMFNKLQKEEWEPIYDYYSQADFMRVLLSASTRRPRVLEVLRVVDGGVIPDFYGQDSELLDTAMLGLRELSLPLRKPLVPMADVRPDWLAEFVGSTSKTLQFLHLSFPSNLEENSVRVFGDFSKDIYLPKLRSLSLKGIECEDEALKAFFRKHAKTLRELKLECITLSRSWEELLVLIADVLSLEILGIYDARPKNQTLVSARLFRRAANRFMYC